MDLVAVYNEFGKETAIIEIFRALPGSWILLAVYMVLIFVAEYLSGTWLRTMGVCPWDYTGRHSNIDGLIRLDFAPLWFMTGLLFEQITKKKGA